MQENELETPVTLPDDKHSRSAGLCMYCGTVFHAEDTGQDEVARVYAEAIEHDQQCQSNPLVKRIKELEATASATRANERNIFVDEDHKRGCEGRSYRCTCGYDEKVMTRGNELEARLSTPPQRYSIVLANGVVTWITTVDGEWVQWDDVQRQYVHSPSQEKT